MIIDSIGWASVNTYASLPVRYDVQGDHSAKTMAFDWWLNDNNASELAARHADRVTRRIQIGNWLEHHRGTEHIQNVSITERRRRGSERSQSIGRYRRDGRNHGAKRLRKDHLT